LVGNGCGSPNAEGIEVIEGPNEIEGVDGMEAGIEGLALEGIRSAMGCCPLTIDGPVLATPSLIPIKFGGSTGEYACSIPGSVRR
jgi:hypothetical protein